MHILQVNNLDFVESKTLPYFPCVCDHVGVITKSKGPRKCVNPLRVTFILWGYNTGHIYDLGL